MFFLRSSADQRITSDMRLTSGLTGAGLACQIDAGCTCYAASMVVSVAEDAWVRSSWCVIEVAWANADLLFPTGRFSQVSTVSLKLNARSHVHRC
jgi:hypothetical protein